MEERVTIPANNTTPLRKVKSINFTEIKIQNKKEKIRTESNFIELEIGKFVFLNKIHIRGIEAMEISCKTKYQIKKEVNELAS
jgi:hypothetical protein